MKLVYFIRWLLSISNTKIIGLIAFVMLFVNVYVFIAIVILNLLYYLVQWWTSYKPIINRINAVTGSAGTGKSPLITDWALHKYRVAYNQYWIQKYLFRHKVEEPLVYSSEPIRLKEVTLLKRILNMFLPRIKRLVYDKSIKDYVLKKQPYFVEKWSNILTSEIVLLRESIPTNSIVVWYEIGASLNTKDYDNVYFDDIRLFLRFYKHFIDGWFFCDEQSVDDIPSVVRRKVGKFYLLSDFKKYKFIFPFNYILEPFLKFGIANVNSFLTGENMTVNANAPTVEKNSELIHISFKRKYIDSYSHSEMYKSVPRNKPIPFDSFKSNKVLSIPSLSKKDYDRNKSLLIKNNLDIEEI